MIEKPAPSYAATIWLAGQNLMVYFESPDPGARGHTIHVPATQLGMSGLLKILRERELAGAQKIGNKSDPTQADMGAILRAMQAHKPEPKPVQRLSPAVLAKLRKVPT